MVSLLVHICVIRPQWVKSKKEKNTDIKINKRLVWKQNSQNCFWQLSLHSQWYPEIHLIIRKVFSDNPIIHPMINLIINSEDDCITLRTRFLKSEVLVLLNLKMRILWLWWNPVILLSVFLGCVQGIHQSVHSLDHLTLKWLGHFFQNVISFSDAVHLMCNIFIWNWSNTMNV